MDTVMLNLEISTLRAIVALCQMTGNSLRSTFEHECTDQEDRRAIFAQWNEVRRISYAAQEELDALPIIR